MIDFKKIPNEDKPRERLFRCGSESLSNEELIAIILKTGTRDMSVKEVALKLLEDIDNIGLLDNIGITTLMKIPGIGKVKAIELKAAVELGKRVISYGKELESVKLNNPDNIFNYFKDVFINKKQEYFYCIYLDVKGNYIDKKFLFKGTINSSIVHPREIFKEAYLLSASRIICIHNHPSGDSNPSKEDILLTRKIKEIAIIHGMELVDHIIIGNDYYSFYENGKL